MRFYIILIIGILVQLPMLLKLLGNVQHVESIHVREPFRRILDGLVFLIAVVGSLYFSVVIASIFAC